MNDGTVVAYAADMEMGVITTRDQKRYIFVKAEWLSSDISPAAGVVVTFEASGPAAKKIRTVSKP
jgi:cold shock CspA family protein